MQNRGREMNYLDIEKRGRDKIKEYKNVALFEAIVLAIRYSDPKHTRR